MSHSFQLSNLGRASRKLFYLLFARPGRPRNPLSLIPAGDPYSSRGQRPRKMRPPQGPIPQARGRIRVTSPRSCGPRPKGIRPLQGRGTSVGHSGGVAPGYYLVPLQGTKKIPFSLTLQHAFLSSRTAASGYPCSEHTRSDLDIDLVWTLGLVKCIEIIGEAAAHFGGLWSAAACCRFPSPEARFRQRLEQARDAKAAASCRTPKRFALAAFSERGGAKCLAGC